MKKNNYLEFIVLILKAFIKNGIFILTLIIWGCMNNSTDNKESVDTPSQNKMNDSLRLEKERQYQEKILRQKINEDSLRLVNFKKQENEINDLRKKGVVGMWKCNITGYESTITFYKKGSKYSTKINFEKNALNMKTKTENLKKNR